MANLSEQALLHIVNAKLVDATTGRSKLDRRNQFLEDRNNAKKEKDFDLADKLRDELTSD